MELAHLHADHLMEFDDIRAININTNRKIPCYGNYHTIQEISKIFPYINNSPKEGRITRRFLKG